MMANIRAVECRSTFLNRSKKGEILQIEPDGLLNPYNLYALLNVRQLDFIRWCQKHGLLAANPRCERCRKVSKKIVTFVTYIL